MAKITKEDWSGFERLIFKMLQDIFGFEENEDNHVTKEQKDGGYDGVFFLPAVAHTPNVADGLYKVIFEAKLRSSAKNDLPLSDFSKSLIVAINISANMIIVATNLHFSLNTRKILNEYSQKTGLQIKLITAVELMQWLRGNGEASGKPLLDGTRIIELIQTAEESAKKHLPETEFNSEHSGAELPRDLQLIGEKRSEQLQHALNAVKHKNGIVLISGDAGVGKSVFSHNLLNKLERENINTGTIDLQQCTTPRLLFVHILEHLWQIPIDILLRMDRWEDTINLIGKGELQSDLKNAVLYAFRQSDQDYSNQASHFNACLIEYLYQVHQVVRRKVAFSFSNVNYASKNLLSFFEQFCARFQTETILVIELRELPVFLNGKTHGLQEDPFQTIRNLQNIRDMFRLEPLDRADGRTYINSLLEPAASLDDLILDQIIDDAGSNPLALSAYVNFLQNDLDLSHTTIQELSRFQKRFHFAGGIIRQFIRSICEKDSTFIGIFAVLGMLNGVTTVDCLNQVLGRDCTRQIEYLIRCHVCVFKGDFLHVWHSLYLANIRQYDYIGQTYQWKLSTALLKNIEQFVPDPQRALMVQIDLNQIRGDNQKAVALALVLIEELYNTGQYYLSYDYGENALKLLDRERSNIDTTLQKIQVLMYVIQASFYIKGDSVQKLQSRIDRTRTLFNLNQYQLRTNALFYPLNCRFYLIENQYYHQFGNFDQAYFVMADALDFLAQNKEHIKDVELAGEIWLEYSIATKELHSLTESITVLNKGLKEYPDSKILQFTLNTQLYEQSCPVSVERSEMYLKNNVSLEPFLKPAEVYHNRVHLLNCRWLSKDYDCAWEIGLCLLDETTSKGLRNEEGRVCNLLACLACIRGDTDNAQAYFDRGIRIFNSDNYVSNLWPLLLNYGVFSAEQKQWKKAVSFLVHAYKLVRQKYAQRIRSLSYDPQSGIPKLLGGLLILWHYLFRLPEDHLTTEILNIRQELALLCDKCLPISDVDNYLTASNYCFGDFFFIGY